MVGMVTKSPHNTLNSRNLYVLVQNYSKPLILYSICDTSSTAIHILPGVESVDRPLVPVAADELLPAAVYKFDVVREKLRTLCFSGWRCRGFSISGFTLTVTIRHTTAVLCVRIM